VRREKKETALDTNSTSSTPAKPEKPEESTVDPVVSEVSAEADEKKGGGLSPHAASRSSSGASTHPTG
jgi:hypothetical protein